jgi:benzylsuccinate synthase
MAVAPFLPLPIFGEGPFLGCAGNQGRKGGNPMATCNECKQYFLMDENPDRGDCVQRVVDPRQAYYKAKPVEADREAGDCPDFQKKS